MLRFTAGVFKTNATKGDLSHGGEGGEPALSFGTGKFPEALIQTNFNSKILFSPSTPFLTFQNPESDYCWLLISPYSKTAESFIRP